MILIVLLQKLAERSIHLGSPTCDGNKLYHFIVDSVLMFSTDDFRGDLIDIICYLTYPIQKLCMRC